MAWDGHLVHDYKESKNYLYTVLNLTKNATQAEIHDRHRSLSLIFHPDKQTGEQLKGTATTQFLEVQKAYQVLSDPFLRQVYDSLGSEGLDLPWPANIRSKSGQEIQDILAETSVNLQHKKRRELVTLKTKTSCSIDATSLSGFFEGSLSFAKVRDGVRRIHAAARGLSYSVEKKLDSKTSIGLGADSTFQGRSASFRFFGTVRHQFSPRITTLATFHLTRPHLTKLDINYDDENNSIEVKPALAPHNGGFLPSVTTSYSRKLFRGCPQRGKVTLHISPQPSIGFFYISPPVLRVDNSESPRLSPPSYSGLRFVAVERSTGVAFDSILPKLIAEASLHLIELSTRLKCSVEYGLAGFLATLGVNWNNEKAEVGTFLVFNAEGIVWEFNFAYLDTQFSMPILLSTHFNPRLALSTVVIPSTAIALGYHFFILPRRRARRVAHLRAARQAFEEDCDGRRQRTAVETLLKDAVKKQVRIETKREGLVVQDATYGAADTDREEMCVLLNVTTQLQVLVRNSQLHIPGGDSRTALQGFSDPAPFVAKSLRIRYSFRGHDHYAEIPDYMPVVLPLAEHKVDEMESGDSSLSS